MTRAIFVVLDTFMAGSHPGCSLLAQRLAGLLRDFKALGFRVFGVQASPDEQLPADTSRTLASALDGLIVAEDPSAFSFPDRAFALARQHSLDLRGSILVSADDAHQRWASDAGLRRFETPSTAFGL